ncbi:MAG: enoyl-CoA hydratase-related protein, partial [Pseudomonadales bacterium]
LNYLPKPTIARVQGAAFGGGVGLVSCCDIAVATSRASFCLSEVKIGLIPATISPYVVRAIGEKAARRYFTTAERFSAATALKLGLVSELVEEEQLDTCVSGLAECLLNNGPEAITKAKQLVFDVANREVSDALVASTSRAIADVRGSAEGREGLTAFLEKRKPDWNR